MSKIICSNCGQKFHGLTVCKPAPVQKVQLKAVVASESEAAIGFLAGVIIKSGWRITPVTHDADTGFWSFEALPKAGPVGVVVGGGQ